MKKMAAVAGALTLVGALALAGGKAAGAATLPAPVNTGVSVAANSDPLNAWPPPGIGNLTAQIPLWPGPYPASCPNGYVDLSFDNGPTDVTPSLVAMLKRLHVKATFFDWGDRAQELPADVALQATQGQVENHTYSHSDLLDMSYTDQFNELLGTNEIIQSITGQAPTLFRPPFDLWDSQTAALANVFGMTLVTWTTDVYDYVAQANGKPMTTAELTNYAKAVPPGGILLFHDDYTWTVKALPSIVNMLHSRGLCAGQIVPSQTPTVTTWGDTYYAMVGPA